MRRRWAASVLALTLVVLPLLVVRAASAAGTDSAVTIAGRGEFSSLKVTVSQTSDLINQVATVSWTGGVPTVDVGVYLDYLQIMQCWGDDAGGPRREQCQFGALFTDARGGTWTGTRQVSYGPGLGDPAETIKPAPQQQAYVPFTSVTGPSVATGGGGEFFDASSTNEIPYGRTRPDGTGEEFFEIQTAAEAPGLGCGERRADATARSCWLVIVPRGETEVNGSAGDARPHRWLDSSPLSATNWAQRMVVPLRFQPLGRACPIGSAERRTVGAEVVTEAMLRWQPAMCAGGGTVFGYSQVTDDLARGRLGVTDPGLVFTNRPAAPDPARPQVYAPVAVTGLAIAVNVEWQSLPDAPEEVRRRDGRRAIDLRLTPKLVAKLLTQSYRSGADINRPALAKNPLTMRADPEFIRYNPDFDSQLDLPLGDALMPLGQTDLATLLWEYVYADPQARAFLAGVPDRKPDGEPDPDGMRVNPVYQTQSWPQDNFPKSDLYCVKLRGDGGDEREWCTLDMHPYATNMHDAARAASRGDTLVHNATARDNTGTVIGWKKGTPQAPGKRAVLALTDVATAERYGLPMARLQNPLGSFVAPSTQSLLAGVDAMKPGTVPGVLTPNPQPMTPEAYPLTTVAYAATVPSKLSAAAGRDYAALLRYAAGPGQVPGVEPGTLPFGYAPLPASLREVTLAAATTVARDAGKSFTPAPSTPAPTTPAGAPPPVGVPTTTPPTTSPTRSVPAAGTRPSAALPAATPSGRGAPVPVAQSVPTPGSPVGLLRYVLPALLAAGGLAALAGPILLRRTRPRRSPAPRGGM